MDVRLDNITMKFDRNTAIEGLSVTIQSGELVTLLGPSGCGKSTTLFMLAGLYRPTAGRIWFGDQDVTDAPPENRGIGMVFQNYALYPHMSVLKNIMFPLRMNNMPKAEAERVAVEMAEKVQIGHLLERKPKQLSGGQQQRVAIARALVKRPKLLLLDEPLSNLDARLRLGMREEIRRIQQDVGITTIFVTHDQEEAMSISDQIILMNLGSIQQYSTPSNMYQLPQNLFAAAFIGSPSMNIVHVKQPDGSIFKLGVRPEDLVLASNRNGALFEGQVVYRESIGRDTLIKVRHKESEITVTALIPRTQELNIGDEAILRADKDRVHWFDNDSGTRISRSGLDVQFITVLGQPEVVTA